MKAIDFNSLFILKRLRHKLYNRLFTLRSMRLSMWEKHQLSDRVIIPRTNN